MESQNDIEAPTERQLYEMATTAEDLILSYIGEHHCWCALDETEREDIQKDYRERIPDMTDADIEWWYDYFALKCQLHEIDTEISELLDNKPE